MEPRWSGCYVLKRPYDPCVGTSVGTCFATNRRIFTTHDYNLDKLCISGILCRQITPRGACRVQNLNLNTLSLSLSLSLPVVLVSRVAKPSLVAFSPRMRARRNAFGAGTHSV